MSKNDVTLAEQILKPLLLVSEQQNCGFPDDRTSYFQQHGYDIISTTRHAETKHFVAKSGDRSFTVWLLAPLVRLSLLKASPCAVCSLLASNGLSAVLDHLLTMLRRFERFCALFDGQQRVGWRGVAWERLAEPILLSIQLFRGRSQRLLSVVFPRLMQGMFYIIRTSQISTKLASTT